MRTVHKHGTEANQIKGPKWSSPFYFIFDDIETGPLASPQGPSHRSPVTLAPFIPVSQPPFTRYCTILLTLINLQALS